MILLIDIGHPAHVHYFRNLYKELIPNHDIIVTTRDVPIIKKLLTYYQIPYIILGSKADNIALKGLKQISYVKQVVRIIKQKKIELTMGVSAIAIQAAKLAGIPSILFDDDDQNVQILTKLFVTPYATIILSPDTLSYEHLKNCIYYPSYHELAYLHPSLFTPDLNVLKKYGINEKDKYFVLRFNAFKAHHDLSMGGMGIEQKRKLINTLKEYGRIYISSETLLETEFEEFRCPFSPEDMHSVLSYATMFISDSQTMTTEAALLGVPAIRCNSFVGKLMNIEELEKKYYLTIGFLPFQFNWMLYRIKTMLANNNIKEEWKIKRDQLLKDKISTTAFWKYFVDYYPHSIREFRKADCDYVRFK